jgi:hypothetical protein
VRSSAAPQIAQDVGGPEGQDREEHDQTGLRVRAIDAEDAQENEERRQRPGPSREAAADDQ